MRQLDERRRFYFDDGGAVFPLLTNLAAFWQFEEDGSDTLGNYDLTANNTPSTVTGLIGNAQKLTASNFETFNRAYEAGFHVDGEPFSWVIWYQATMSTSGRVVFPVFRQGARTWYQIYQEQNTMNVFYNILNNFAGTQVSLGATTASAWNMLYFDFDGVTTGRASLNNGTLQTLTQTMQTGLTPDLLITSGTGGVDGDLTIDNSAYWRRTLTTDERTWLYNAGAGRSYAELLAYRG